MRKAQLHGWREGAIVKIMELEVTESEEQTLRELSGIVTAAAGGPLEHVTLTWTDYPKNDPTLRELPMTDGTHADHDR